MTHSNEYFVDDVKKNVRLLTYIAIVLFTTLAVITFFPAYSEVSLNAFKFLATGIACFMAGCLWGIAFILQVKNKDIEFHRFGLIWGGLLVVLISCGTLLLTNKVGLFLGAIAFLLLWQIENKTNLVRLYPEWYWVLRTKATMSVALLHMVLWMVQS
jgi:hypothetical protein